ncbi:hypothetical protein HY357_03235 [Candidatus Roizmanbacteria bacterium]|nr:hypothetical protein [Candidatus Roizmanbacteria bacterium]
MNSDRNNMARKPAHIFILTFFVFTFIFSAYFASAAGLYNSTDAPQFFTTEALMSHRSPDLSVYSKDPHFFVYPDVIKRQGKILGMRGYLLSFFAIPLHVISRVTKYVFKVSDFPKKVQTANFAYELSVTSFFTIFSVLGLMFIFATSREITKNSHIASLTTLLLAFGSYIWKYSSMYTRQGFMVFLLGLSVYSMWRWINHKKILYFAIVCLCWAVSFGIDVSLFISFSVYMFFYFLYKFMSFLLYRKNKEILGKGLVVLIASTPIIFINMILNFVWYGSLHFYLYQHYRLTASIPTEKLNNFLIGTPLFPTLISVFLNFGRLPNSSFSPYSEYPQIAQWSGVQFAKVYPFYGLFVISPFLFFCIAGFILILLKAKKLKSLAIFCFTIFSVGIVLNTKFSGFYSPNTYDVRYFYPYVLLLGVPIAVAFEWIFTVKDFTRKLLGIYLLLASALFSLLMGWIGVLSMFKPALTGERRLWVNVTQIDKMLSKYTPSRLFNETFMNFRNVWVAIVFSLILFLLVKKISTLMIKFQNNKKEIH